MNSEQVCRVCLSPSDELKSVHAKLHGNNQTVVETITFVVNINIKLEKGLPNKICTDCESKLNLAYVFKQRCLESEAILDEHVNFKKDKGYEELLTVISKKIQIPAEYTKNFCLSSITHNSSTDLLENKTDNSVLGSSNKDSVDCFINIKVEEINDNDKTIIESQDFKNYMEELKDQTQQDTKTELMNSGNQVSMKKDYDIEVPKLSDKAAFFCDLCKENFCERDLYKAHLLRHHDQESLGDFECGLCCKKLQSQYDFKEHLRTHVPKFKRMRIDRYQCKTCNREFTVKSHLIKHVQNCNFGWYTCKGCEKNFLDKESLEAHKAKHNKDKDKQVCPICGITLKTNAQSLLTHIRRHQNIRAFNCDNCDKSFVTKEELKVHKRSHTGAHPYLCNICGRGFTTNSSLRLHRINIHTKERPFTCDICAKTFKTLAFMNRHRSVHLGERPLHPCPVCGKKFPRNYHVVQHLKTHARDTPNIDQLIAQFAKKPGRPPVLAQTADDGDSKDT